MYRLIDRISDHRFSSIVQALSIDSRWCASRVAMPHGLICGAAHFPLSQRSEHLLCLLYLALI